MTIAQNSVFNKFYTLNEMLDFACYYLQMDFKNYLSSKIILSIKQTKRYNSYSTEKIREIWIESFKTKFRHKIF